MSTHTDPHGASSDVVPAEHADVAHGDGADAGTDVARLDGFGDPGLPPHRHRLADIDAGAARRAERQVATLFGLSALGTLAVLIGYFAIKFNPNASYVDYARRLQLSNLVLGLGLFVALFGIGVGAVHWAKTLMPDDERIDYRHLQRGTHEERASAVAILKEGAAEAGLGRRPLIRNSLIGALALVPLPMVVFLRDMGPLPGKSLSETLWKAGTRLVRDPTGGPLKASDVSLGSVVHIMPEAEGTDGEPPENLNERAKAAVLLIRLKPDELTPASRARGYEGIVAYSKICTHLGCPVALYEQATHQLLCPCHQSSFDLTHDCKVVFGPAKRALPQLAITVDADGYLVAKEGFTEAVGPSFWERG